MGFSGHLGPLAVGNIMRKFIKVLGLVACLSTVGVAASFALPVLPPLPLPPLPLPPLPLPGGGAPAPEIGATALGLLGAAGLAAYLRARRQG
jgi:hypothetical protein